MEFWLHFGKFRVGLLDGQGWHMILELFHGFLTRAERLEIKKSVVVALVKPIVLLEECMHLNQLPTSSFSFLIDVSIRQLVKN